MAQTVGQTVVQGLVEDERVPADSDRPRGRLGRPRRDAGDAQLISEEMTRRLVEQAREEGWISPATDEPHSRAEVSVQRLQVASFRRAVAPLSLTPTKSPNTSRSPRTATG